MSKYGATKSGKYASKREAKRAQELELMEKAGFISDLAFQVKFELIPKQDGERAVTYTCDAQYKLTTPLVQLERYVNPDGLVVEDSKGFKTQQYIIRRKLMLWVHKTRILET